MPVKARIDAAANSCLDGHWSSGVDPCLEKHGSPYWLLAILSAFFLAISPLSAQPGTVLSRPVLGKSSSIVPVAVSHAYSGMLSEAHSWLVFCHDKTYEEAQVSLVKLDAKGQPEPYAIAWHLPRPEGLPKSPHYALAVAAHPKLPLIYVWMDVASAYPAAPIGTLDKLQKVNHLLIYRMEKDRPELLLSLCHGTSFVWGSAGGAVTIDPEGSHLYVPNLRNPAMAGSFRFARFPLDADGLPILNEADAKLKMPERLKKLAERVAGSEGIPADLTPLDYVYLFPNSNFGAGHSFHILSKDSILAGGVNGVINWRHDDPQAIAHQVPLKGSAPSLLTPHPVIPTLYVTRSNTDTFFKVDHFDGYLSLLPYQYTVPDTRLYSAPAVFDQGKQMAIGGHHSVYLFKLDDQGRVLPPVERMPIVNPAARVLLSSTKFNRVYAAVEQSR